MTTQTEHTGDLTLIIGNKNYSSWSLRPWIWMQTAGLAFAEHRIALSTPDTHARLAPYFSNAKVPILLHGNRRIWDSLAILEYLAEHFPTTPGWPSDPAARSVARSVSAEMHSSFAALRAALPMNCRRRPKAIAIHQAVRIDIDRICQIWRHCRTHFGNNGPWLFGRFSIADAMYAPIVWRFVGYDIAVDATAANYIRHYLQHPPMQAWKAAGEAETEVIEDEEI